MSALTKDLLQAELDHILSDINLIKLDLKTLSDRLSTLLVEHDSIYKLMELRGWVTPKKIEEDCPDYSVAVEEWVKGLASRVITTTDFSAWLVNRKGIIEPNRNAIRTVFEKMKERGFTMLLQEGQGRSPSTYRLRLSFITNVKAGKHPLSKGEL